MNELLQPSSTKYSEQQNPDVQQPLARLHRDFIDILGLERNIKNWKTDSNPWQYSVQPRGNEITLKILPTTPTTHVSSSLCVYDDLSRLSLISSQWPLGSRTSIGPVTSS